ncbi:MAG: hypothetical protein ACRDP9_00690 [Kribbellaceae bacterium]
MTGPDGDTPRGWWRITAVNPPKSLEFIDGFACQDRIPDRAVYDTCEQMEQLISIGMAEGLQQAIGQMDALLRD